MTSELLSLIGNTPLVELTRFSPKPGIRIFAKLEGQNPSGSVKDRIVLAMVEQAERNGMLKPGDTIVEASSGNTGIALAMVGKQKGYNVKVVIPRQVAPSIKDILDLYEAEVVWCEPVAGMKGAIDIAQKEANAAGHYLLGQFSDATNVQAHYHGTGSEIVEALPDVDVFVAGIGTGGTVMGVGKRLRETNPDVRIIGVEPRLGEQVQGLRSLAEGFIPPLLDLDQLDGRFLVGSAAAMETAHNVIRAEGIMAGVSAGATLHAALRIAERMDKGNIVVMFSDGTWKYLPAQPWAVAAAGGKSLDETHWW